MRVFGTSEALSAKIAGLYILVLATWAILARSRALVVLEAAQRACSTVVAACAANIVMETPFTAPHTHSLVLLLLVPARFTQNAFMRAVAWRVRTCFARKAIAHSTLVFAGIVPACEAVRTSRIARRRPLTLPALNTR